MAGGSSTGPPAFFQAPKPPRICATGFKPHLLRGVGGERRAHAAGAEEHVLLVLSEKRLVIRAFRIDPEFQHAARAMKGARDFAVALQFADVADIDQHDVVLALQLKGLIDRQVFDVAFGFFDERFNARGDALGHVIAFSGSRSNFQNHCRRSSQNESGAETPRRRISGLNTYVGYIAT